ncbi:MAG: hypothetical protein K2G20_10490 [Lachnospiraceae bacterium]|nr:hypothetical protein [Lachnospiraceae bacterium]
MNIPVVVEALKELSDWLDDSKSNQERVNRIIGELENRNISEQQLQELKFELSTKMLFHPKYLGDIDVPDFVGDGSAYAWWNYLAEVAEICQVNL